MQQDDEITDLLRNFMRNDGNGGDDTQLRALHERCRHQNAVDEIVKAVADDDQQTTATVIRAVVVMMVMVVVVRMSMPLLVQSRRLACRRRRSFQIFQMEMPPQHQFFQDEKQKYAAQHRRCQLADTTGLLTGTAEGMRQDFQKRCTEQGADGHAHQMRNPGTRRSRSQPCSQKYR